MSNNIREKEIWLVGSGPMAVDHAKVLLHLGFSPKVIGRGEQSALAFEKETGLSVSRGGIDTFLEGHKPSDNTFIIVAVGTEALMPILLKFKGLSFNRILIEKPAAISIRELLNNTLKLEGIAHKVFVAYNRRFYASVKEAMCLIDEDGGLKSMHFEFTEWWHRIEPLNKAEGVKENWFFANSTHVVDLAFYLAGQPSDWTTFSQKGQNKVHPITNFSGAGITEKGVLFSYISNWESAGRWGIELMTNARRIYLRPMEKVYIQMKGSITIEEHQCDLTIDEEFKPGLYEQCKVFLDNDLINDSLFSLKDQITMSKNIYQRILYANFIS